MPDQTHRPWLAIAVGVGVVAALGAGLFLLLHETESTPSGPVEVIWDGDVCAHCRMHVGEPAFAAQLHTLAGDVLHFDDPGCLFEYVAENGPETSGAWFHHVREDRWIPADQVGFERVDHSPMGFGLGAVEAGPAAELTFEQARDWILEPQVPNDQVGRNSDHGGY